MNVWIVPLEKIETRYTCEWYEHIPKMLLSYASNSARGGRAFDYDNATFEQHPGFNIVNIPGDMPEQTAGSGAFLNFASTNIWKSSQAVSVARAFHSGHVQHGDKFYFTDAWNPTILQVRYMADLLGIDIEIHAQWHAGVHDPYDILSQRMGDKPWPRAAEQALFDAIDYNYFTTKFYQNLFAQYVSTSPQKIVRCGYPNSYLIDVLAPYKSVRKERIILFPHRLAAEKQLDIFLDLERQFKDLPGFGDVRFVVAQDQPRTKKEYHELLGKSAVVFSAALQETYGIAQTEAVFAGSIPLSPNRLSYAEMYLPEFKYPSSWSLCFDAYLANRDSLVHKIKELLVCGVSDSVLATQDQHLRQNYIGDLQISSNLLTAKF